MRWDVKMHHVGDGVIMSDQQAALYTASLMRDTYMHYMYISQEYVNVISKRTRIVEGAATMSSAAANLRIWYGVPTNIRLATSKVSHIVQKDVHI